MFNKILILTVPSEVKLMKKEHFNRWYGLNSFYMAMTLSKIPVQVITLLFHCWKKLLDAVLTEKVLVFPTEVIILQN